jgi:hypothetical protein
MIMTMQLTVAGDETARSRITAGLREMPGVEEAVADGDALRIRYDLRATNCAQIVERVVAGGLVPVLGRLQGLRLRLRCYREAIRREGINNELGWDSFVREIYVSRYRHRRHGRRDDRPRHWRQYPVPPTAD